MKKYILSIDQGTTSSRAILFDKKGELVASAAKEISLIYPQEGYVEVDALEIWSSVVDVINNLLIKANTQWSEIDSVGITNQRETTVVWDKKTGAPICNAIVWQSRQSLKICESLSKKETIIHNKTGLPISRPPVPGKNRHKCLNPGAAGFSPCINRPGDGKIRHISPLRQPAAEERT